MSKKNDKILLGHGSGGRLSNELISKLFQKHFKNDILDQQSDSAVIDIHSEKLSFTTDSFVVDPIFFAGGNIGKIAICGTVNDLSVSGAIPKYLTCSFIIEEGFPMVDLEKIVITMAEEARNADIKIVTGDTKVVNKGKCDKIFINTAGIGLLEETNSHISGGFNIKAGDKIIINGDLADHSVAVLSARQGLNFETPIKSDCASLNHLIKEVLDSGIEVNFMRDATRGGVATVLCELAEQKKLGIEINENDLPLKEAVSGACEIFGFDPLYMANEGKVLMVISQVDAEKCLSILKQNPLGKNATIIGEFVEDHKGKVTLNTEIGGKRIVDMLAGEQLPRIC